jgi:NTE family protein
VSHAPRIALALGGGGARGYAHIGVIQVLQERGYEIVAISGTSMGALVGGLHAAGALPAYADWVTGMSPRDFLRLLDPALRGPGAIRGEKVLGRVAELLDGARIEQLAIPFTAVATDLLARKEVWFQRGSVDVAIRASTALPTVFPPVMLNGRLLADGGLMNPVPLDPLASVRADAVIAVSLAGVDRLGASSPAEESADDRPSEEWLDRFRRSAAQVLDRDQVKALTRRLPGTRAGALDATASDSDELGAPDDTVPDTLPRGLGTTEVVDLSLDAMQDLVTRYRIAAFPPDLLITVPKNASRTLDFHKARELVALGREIASKALDASPVIPKP